MRRALAWFVAVFFVGALVSNALADACDECKDGCRKEKEDCQNAAPEGFCNGPAGPVCEWFRGFGCTGQEIYCVKVGCGVGGPCGGAGGAASVGGGYRGDPHLYSLDRLRFDLQTVGEYVAARSEKADLEVQARFVQYGEGPVAVAAVTAVRTGGHVLVFERNEAVVIDGKPARFVEGTSWLEKEITLTQLAVNRYVLSAQGTELWITVGQWTLDVRLRPDESTRGSWVGLLGNFDGKTDDDIKTRDGKVFTGAEVTRDVVYGEFSDSWRVTQEESFLPYGDGETTETYTDRSFPGSFPTVASLDAAAFAKARAACIAKGVRHGAALRDCIYDVGISGAEELAADYVDALDVEPVGAIRFPGKLAMHVQKEGYQGSEAYVYWDGDPTADAYLQLSAADGTRVGGRPHPTDSPYLLRLPTAVGPHTIELVQGEQKVSATIEVLEAKATIDVPATVRGAEEFSVGWTGPIGEGDLVALTKAGEKDPDTRIAFLWATRPEDAKFQAPADPGTYEVRYVLHGAGERKVIASKTIEVTEPVAGITAPVPAEAGAFVDVAWNGPGASGDYLDIVTKGTTDISDRLTFAWTSSTEDGTLQLRAPGDAGSYELRYIASTSAGPAVIASAALEVTAATATVEVPKGVTAAGELEVPWTGPGRSGDFVAIVAAGETSPNNLESFTWAAYGSPAKLTAPKTAGAYEVVYVMAAGDGRRFLAREALDVGK